MPYFVILPLFVGALALEGLFLGLCALVPRLRAHRACVGRALLGSTLGFLGANGVSLLIGLVPVGLGAAFGVDRDSTGAQVVVGFTILGLFVGPLIASPLGFVGGAWVGWRRARRAGSVGSVDLRAAEA